jgi:hypothetical protein
MKPVERQPPQRMAYVLRPVPSLEFALYRDLSLRAVDCLRTIYVQCTDLAARNGGTDG